MVYACRCRCLARTNSWALSPLSIIYIIIFHFIILIGCTGLPAVSGILRTQARRRGSRHPGHCRRKTDLLLRLRRRPSASPPPSCLAARSRARCHAGRVTGPGPGSGPPPLRLACRAPWARCGPVPRMPGPRGARCGPVALTVCCLRRGLAGPAPPPLLRAFSRGRMPEWRIATAQRRWDPALAAARLVGVRCWGRHCRMRIAVCVHRGPLAASHGSVRGRGPERRSVTAQLSRGPAPSAAGPAGVRTWAGPSPADRLRIRVTAGAPLYGLARDRRSRRGPESESAVGAG